MPATIATPPAAAAAAAPTYYSPAAGSIPIGLLSSDDSRTVYDSHMIHVRYPAAVANIARCAVFIVTSRDTRRTHAPEQQ